MTQKPVFIEGIFTLRNLRSMGTAAILEILIASGVAAILLWQQLRPEVAPLPKPPPVVEFHDPVPVLPRTDPALPRQPEAQHLSEVPPIQESVPSPTAQPVQPLPPLQRFQPSTDLAAEFAGRMLQAINDQKVYPKAPLLQGITGETVVSFDYLDGVASNIHVDRSSGSHELDAAAVEAVQRAVLPSKPAELAGLTHFIFHLEFSLNR